MSKTRTSEERHNLNKEIGARCQEVRLAANLTQEKLAEKLNVSTQYISDMERGVAGLSLLTMIDLSNLLSVSTDYLMKGTTEKTKFIIQIGARTLELSEKEYCILENMINTTIEAFNVNK